MRALSVWQPWAFSVVHLGKRIENREQWTACNVRGPFLIHAALGVGTRRQFHDAAERVTNTVDEATALRFRDEHLDITTIKRQAIWLPRPSLHRGGIIGVAEVVDVIKGEQDMATYDLSQTVYPHHYKRIELDQRRWWFGGFALVLKNVIPLQFRPYVGKQGWFDVPEAEPIMRDGRFVGVNWKGAGTA
ncbi:MAG: hypothetical protein HOW73_20175 [Polyangiaceae bacterium]|nr:hypothetical protein [Polyangiaceae bacterium]